ncbi:SMR family transporter [Paracoccus onubensis]|uniref:QacE family quaternary ammonium compound efflux SMR transporter n=1 Tax=Paracoccus onubensis TaxID=1675788 RepID=A0A418SMD9_9RHOB|nr:SMR family transporter [Paracoccus onubensis]RJE82128.1 QacE family quaternary ammonium compound efflux SMR transporter [Paracoccus onubensis]
MPRGDVVLLLPYIALLVAIVLEVVGTSLLQLSAQFTRPLPTIGMAICYLLSFYLLSVSLKVLPLGIAYAVWSGVGIVLVAMIGLVVFGQRLDLPAVIGLGLIVLGVLVVNLFSKTVGH